MTQSPWWLDVSISELLELRRRLLKETRSEFGAALPGEVEDLVQHAFVVLLRRRGDVDAKNDGLYRYLRTVAFNAARDRIKTLRTRRQNLPGLAAERERRMARDPAATSPEGILADDADKVWQVFCALDDLDRLILWSHVVEGRSIRAIARHLGLNWHRVAGIVERTLREARRQLTRGGAAGRLGGTGETRIQSQENGVNERRETGSIDRERGA
jgi:RNA polymerase sigma factor (sigma-70 family)